MFIYIYKLIKKGAVNDDMVYIGSTNDVKWRMYNHKCRCTNPESPKYNYKVYKYIRENGGFDEWEMIVIDEIEVPLIKCEQRDKYEQEYITKYDAVNKLNIHYSSRTHQEYREENRELIRERDKIYYENNRELLLEKKKVYRENNREILSEKKKINYYKNRELLLEKKKQKVCCCICGSFVGKDDLCKHQRTQKCINFKNLAI